METLKDIIYEFHPDTLETVRRNTNLHKFERLKEALDLLEEWLKKQNHFVNKNISRKYLEGILVDSKGSVERTKERLDKLFTYKTLMPEFYQNEMTSELFSPLENKLALAHLPKLTKEHYRMAITKILGDDFSNSDVMLYYKYVILFCEYQKMHDYNDGLIFLLDARDVNIFNFLKKLNPIELKNFFHLTTEGYGAKVKRIDILSGSKMVDSLVTFFKQIFSAKIGGRIYTHKSIETINEVVGNKDIMPADYGGEEIPLKELSDKWRNILLSKEHIEFFNKMRQAKTDESYRRLDKFNEHYMGMPGSFRSLTVD